MERAERSHTFLQHTKIDTFLHKKPLYRVYQNFMQVLN